MGPSWSEFLRAQAQSMLGAGLPSEPGGGLDGNVSARSTPSPAAAARNLEAEKLSNDGTVPDEPIHVSLAVGSQAEHRVSVR
jgi:hypothetical protein